jgi:hypothetical protein
MKTKKIIQQQIIKNNKLMKIKIKKKTMNMLSTVMKILKPALLSLSFCFDFLEEERKKENYFLSYLVVGPP